MFDPKHLAVVRELNNHPLNQAALRWLVEVERPGTRSGSGRRTATGGTEHYDLHVLAFLRWAIENQSLRGRLKEEMIRHWDFLEASPKKGLQYLLRF